MTRLTPAECVLRLQALINREPDGYDKPWGGGGWSSIVGEVTADTLSLRERTPRGDMMAAVSATIRADDRGSNIVGFCGVHPQSARLRRMGAWTALLLGGPLALLFLGELCVGNVRHVSDLVSGPPFGALFGMGSVLFMNGIFYANELTARAYAARLKRFLVYVLEAHVA